MQVYRGMDIGTAKPSKAERATVAHHLVDAADPWEDWSVARFQAEARAAVAAIEARGHRALLLGGTGLYVQAVVDDLRFPGEDLALRAELTARVEGEPDGLAAAYRELERADPPAAARIEPSNLRRIVRALEVIRETGRPFSSFGPGVLQVHADPRPVRTVGLWIPRSVGAQRIEQRIVAMIEAGFVDEVARLAGEPGRLSSTAREAIGYKEILAHLDGSWTLPYAQRRIADRTRGLARRQRVWFRRDRRIAWIGCAGNSLATLPAVLATWNRTIVLGGL